MVTDVGVSDYEAIVIVIGVINLFEDSGNYPACARDKMIMLGVD